MTKETLHELVKPGELSNFPEGRLMGERFLGPDVMVISNIHLKVM